MRPDRIPLFPLNVVLLPGADLPLHIFEPRYRQMVRQCLQDTTEFGMLLAMPNGVVRVGCTAEIVKVVNRYRDGRLDIVCLGRAPFRIVELFSVECSDESPLLEGLVDYLDDMDGPAGAQAQRELIELYETCHTLIFDDYPKNISRGAEAPAETAQFLSYIIASTLPMDLLWKQQILELRSEADRQERLLGYLRAWAPHLQKTGSMRAQSAGNGHALN